jgi:hypothetical protein
MAISLPIVSKFDDRGVNSAMDGLKKFGAVAGIAAAAATAAFVAVGVESVKAAADLEQSIGGVEAVFKEYASTVERTSKNAAQNLGLSRDAYNKVATIIGTQLKSSGTTLDQLAGKTNDLVTVAADLAATFGGDVTEATTAVTSALRGEFEPLRRFGIALSVAQIESKALEMTQKDLAKELTAAEKSAATQALIFQGAADASGQFARESETLAGKQQRLNAELENIKAVIGEALLPSVVDATDAFAKFIGELVESPEFNTFLETMATNFTKLLEYLPSILESFTVLGNELMPALNSVLGLFASALGTATSGAEGAQGPLINLVNVIDDLAFFSTLALDAFNDMIAGIAGDENASEWGKVVGYMTPVTGQLQLMADLGQAVRDMLTILDGSLTTNTQKWNAWRDALRGLPIIGGMIPAAPGIRPYVPGGLKLAEGGIVMPRPGGTLATIGEAGQAEAVIPLNRFDDIVGKRGGGGIVINVNAGMGTDGAAVGEQIVNAIRRYERTSGAVFAKV